MIFKGSALIGNGCKIDIKKDAILEIGRNTGITGDTTINCHEHISIGDYFSCAWNVTICDTDFHECYHFNDKGKYLPSVNKPIEIGKYVWICQNATILKGTTISDWCTVASNALARGNYVANNYSIIAGIPAKKSEHKLIRNDLYELSLMGDFMITKGINVFG